jgi:hypothetical protein
VDKARRQLNLVPDRKALAARPSRGRRKKPKPEAKAKVPTARKRKKGGGRGGRRR